MEKHNKDQNLRGHLIMAANSLGLPGDIPTRALAALAEADLLIFEEDRIARQTLKAAGITRPYAKFNEHFQQDALDLAKSTLKEGKSVVYMSDQGSPNLADPGRHLCELAFACQAKITVIPGPSAVTAAISACPFDLSSFYYGGFLHREEERRQKELKALAQRAQPLILMDTPYRLGDVLKSCKEALGDDWQGFLALDISGPEEHYLLGSWHKLALVTEGKKLNFVLITSLYNKKAKPSTPARPKSTKS